MPGFLCVYPLSMRRIEIFSKFPCSVFLSLSLKESSLLNYLFGGQLAYFFLVLRFTLYRALNIFFMERMLFQSARPNPVGDLGRLNTFLATQKFKPIYVPFFNIQKKYFARARGCKGHRVHLETSQCSQKGRVQTIRKSDLFISPQTVLDK